MKNILVDADSFQDNIKSSEEDPDTIYYYVSSDYKTMRSLMKKYRADKKKKVFWKSDLNKERIEDIAEAWIGSINEKELVDFAKNNRGVKKVFFKQALEESENISGFLKKSSTELERDFSFHAIGDFEFKILNISSYSSSLFSTSERRSYLDKMLENTCMMTFARSHEELPLPVKSEKPEVNAMKKLCFACFEPHEAPEGWTVLDISKSQDGEFKALPKILQKSFFKMHISTVMSSFKDCKELDESIRRIIYLDSSLKTQDLDVLESLKNADHALTFLDNAKSATIDEMLRSPDCSKKDVNMFKKNVLFNYNKALEDYDKIFSGQPLNSDFFILQRFSNNELFRKSWYMKCNFPAIDDDIVLSVFGALTESEIGLLPSSLVLNSALTYRQL